MAAICLDFKWLGLRISDPIPKSGPFATQPLFDYSKSRLVWISESHSIDKDWNNFLQIYQDFQTKNFDEKVAKLQFYQILCGVYYMHEKKVTNKILGKIFSFD